MIVKFHFYQDVAGDNTFMEQLDATTFVTVETGDYQVESTELAAALCEKMREITNVLDKNGKPIRFLMRDEAAYKRETPNGQWKGPVKIQ